MTNTKCKAALFILFCLLLVMPAVAQTEFRYTTNNGKITINGSAGYKEFNGDVNIPSTINGLPVVSIGSSAFYLHQRMTSVVIQNGVTDIGATAFQSCSKLAHVEIPDSVTSIGFGAFSGCHDLTAINVPKGVVG